MIPTCPGMEQLRSLIVEATGDRLAHDPDEVEEHVESCPSCQARLEALTVARGLPGLGEVDSLKLDADANAYPPFLDEFMAAPPGEILSLFRRGRDARPAPNPARPPKDSAPADLPVVPGYVLLRELGRGGMGVVYKARQVSLNRFVALKMILAGGHAGRVERDRFRREAESVAGLQHPHIVQIYEVGEHEGQPYLALELVEGESLSQKLCGKPQPSRDSALLIATLARAVHFAHECGVAHRDIKPANILIDLHGVPRLTDFGLAKRLDEGTLSLTDSGQFLGTPSYMAPEQATSRCSTESGGPVRFREPGRISTAWGPSSTNCSRGAPRSGASPRSIRSSSSSMMSQSPPRGSSPGCRPTWRRSALPVCEKSRNTAIPPRWPWPRIWSVT